MIGGGGTRASGPDPAHILARGVVRGGLPPALIASALGTTRSTYFSRPVSPLFFCSGAPDLLPSSPAYPTCRYLDTNAGAVPFEAGMPR